MKKFFNKTIITSSLLLSLLLFGQSILFAQAQRGKITGRVVDDATNEPLTGATVILQGTHMGAGVDTEGKFFILNVPVGSYTLNVSMVGYASVNIKNVEVNIDRTTELSFRLKDKSIQTSTVEIVADRPKVIKDQTSSASTLTEETIKAAPVEGLRGMIDLSTSFQKNSQGDYQVRGSGTNEVSFQINGVEQVNSDNAVPGWGSGTKANNSWKYDVNPIGVAQMQMITGGFNAEYGNAQAGVVKVVMKEGSSRFTGEFKVEYKPEGQYHWGNYLYDKSNVEWQTWGNKDTWMQEKNKATQAAMKDPNSTTLFSIFGLSNKERYGSLYDKIFKTKNATTSEKAQWDSVVNNEINWAYDVWTKLHTPSEDNPLGVYDYRTHSYQRYLFGFGGPIGKNPDLLKFFFSGEYKKNPTRLPTPEKDQIYQNYIITMTSQIIKNHKFKFMGAFQKYVGGLFSGSDDIRWAGLPNTDFSYKYFVSRDPVRTEQTTTQSFNWVYTINNNSFLETTVSHQYEKYELPYKYLLTWYDKNDYLEGSNDKTGTLLVNGPWWQQEYFTKYENIATDFFQDNRSNSWTLSSDYSNQINNIHFLKAGLKLNYWDLRNSGVTYSFLAYAYVGNHGVAEHYEAYPINASFYLQDKMEFDGLIANVGLRTEAYNFQSNAPVDIYNVFYQGTKAPSPTRIGDPDTKPSETKIVVMPRIGLSFPIGENTAFRLQYGHFASMPVFSQALGTSNYLGWSTRGNPNLDPKKTINYEFGLQQLIDKENRLDVAVYYNDRVTQIGTIDVASYTGNSTRPAGYTEDNIPLYYYNYYSNNTFGSTVGLEVTLESVSYENLSYRLSYTLSQTMDGAYGLSDLYPENAANLQKRTTSNEHISGWDRTHSFKGMLQYNLKDDEGISLFGIKPFSNSIFSLIYTVQSGTPYTYQTEFDLKDVYNNRRWPLESSFDFNFTKSINYGDVRLILGLRVMNLFDNQWLTPQDNSNYSWANYGITLDEPYNQNTTSYLIYPYRAYRNIPRQIFFTLGVGFN